MVSKLFELTLVGVCMTHSSELDWIRECVASHVSCQPVRTEDLCHWHAVLRSVENLDFLLNQGEVKKSNFSTAKKNPNQQSYHIHLICAHYCNGMWQHNQNSINSWLDDIFDTFYQKLNKKRDTLLRYIYVTYNTEKNTHTFHSQVVNLTNIKSLKNKSTP